MAKKKVVKKTTKKQTITPEVAVKEFGIPLLEWFKDNCNSEWRCSSDLENLLDMFNLEGIQKLGIAKSATVAKKYIQAILSYQDYNKVLTKAELALFDPEKLADKKNFIIEERQSHFARQIPYSLEGFREDYLTKPLGDIAKAIDYSKFDLKNDLKELKVFIYELLEPKNIFIPTQYPSFILEDFKEDIFEKQSEYQAQKKLYDDEFDIIEKRKIEHDAEYKLSGKQLRSLLYSAEKKEAKKKERRENPVQIAGVNFHINNGGTYFSIQDKGFGPVVRVSCNHFGVSSGHLEVTTSIEGLKKLKEVIDTALEYDDYCYTDLHAQDPDKVSKFTNAK